MRPHAPEQPTHYQVLGVEPGATTEQIRGAYRRLAKQLHPDTDPTAGSEARFATIARAYEVLSDRRSRSDYDAQLRRESERPEPDPDELRPHFHWQNVAAPRTGTAAAPSGAGAPERTDFDTLYDTFFGSARSARRRDHADRPEPDQTGAAPTRSDRSKEQASAPRARKRRS